jgi:energy-coupling factor transport system permease protein
MENTYTDMIQIHKKNKVAGLHPNAKTVILVLYMVCTFILGTVHLTEYNLKLLLIPWFFVILILIAASGLTRESVSAMKSVAIVALIIFIAQAFLIPGGRLLWQWRFLKIYENGLQTSISLSFMVMDIAGIFVWFFQSTSNKEISRALEDSGMSYRSAYVFMSSIQMINVLSTNSKSIMNAQKARGVETEGNVLVRSRAFIPALIPLILQAIISSEERVLTLEARGFSLQGKRTSLFVLDRSGWEKGAVILSIIITVAILAGRIALWVI